MLACRPLYGLAEWTQRYESALVGLSTDAPEYFNDDRVGRCLDALFLADRATLMTEIVVHAVEEFDLQLTELHNDSTTVTFTGRYSQADGTPARGRPTHRITYGINKDHRADLKQLLFVLTTTADGSVPIWAHVDHGNTSDDVTHIRTWEALRKLSGAANFLYVADCKLCSAQNLSHIARHGGRFVTVIPATWREHAQFHQWLRTHDAPWVELLRKPNPRRQDDPPDIYGGYQLPVRTAQGFRVLWIWSSQKEALDRGAREQRIEAAEKALHALSARIGQPRSRLNTVSQVMEAVQKVLREKQAEPWIKAEVDGGPSRNVVNVELMLWTYSQTGDKQMLTMATEAWENFLRSAPQGDHESGDLHPDRVLSNALLDAHGVTYAEKSKLPAILFMHTGKAEYLRYAVASQERIFSHCMLIYGIPSASEAYRGTTALDAHETCDIADHMWSWGYLLMATGDGVWGGRIERACFNAGFGAIKKDWEALQYFSAPNQVIATEKSSQVPYIEQSKGWMAYRPNPGENVACCGGNVHRFFPNYVIRMWMTDARGACPRGCGDTLRRLDGPCARGSW